ncbi:MAG: amidohydrolase [Chitinophagaceae bacterium]
MHKLAALFFFYCLISNDLKGQTEKQNNAIAVIKKKVMQELDSKQKIYKDIALQIWNYAEVRFKEVKSSALLQKALNDNGFQMKIGVAGMPTAFIASYGSGKPVIGMLAEFDALPGLAQEAIPEKKMIEGKIAGHACGHHLLGTGSVAAAIEIKKLLEQQKFSGTIRLYGCPAEEGGNGKVFMVKEGLFNDVDVIMQWHPYDYNKATLKTFLANLNVKFRFKGISSHAGAAPEKGRSALDAVEAMDYMVNMMREHVPQETRIHYVITNGGKTPNVVPDFAEVQYTIRHPKKEEVQKIFERVVKAAEGAGLGTGTTMDYELIGGVHDMLLNYTLAEAMHKNLEKVGGVTYTAEEIAYGKKLQATFLDASPPIESAAEIKAFKLETFSGSTDVGDVSYVVPVVGLNAATWIPGTPVHSWQAVACGGTEIGIKGMMVAAKAMALTAIDLYINPALIIKANEEFLKAKGDYKYKSLVENNKPAIN